MSQIVTDAFMSPSFSRLPRRSLGGFFHFPDYYKTRITSNSYVKILHSLTGEELDLREVCTPFFVNVKDISLNYLQADGMCFRRVVWGTGLRIFYVDAMVTLRRLTADFARAFIKRSYMLRMPIEFEDMPMQQKARNLRYESSDRVLTQKNFQPYDVLILGSPLPGVSVLQQKELEKVQYSFQKKNKMKGRGRKSINVFSSTAGRVDSHIRFVRRHEGHTSTVIKHDDIKTTTKTFENRRAIYNTTYSCDNGTIRYNGHGDRVDLMLEYKFRASFQTVKKTLIRDNSPLRILYVSRGVHSRGRSLRNEQVIISTLKRYGAYVIHFTQPYGRCLEDQLSMAYHADVVTLH